MFTGATLPSGKLARNWELLGVVVILLTGSALHFLFAWSGYWKPIAWLAAVNESTWEHLKMAFWPGIGWALVGYGVFGKAVHNYWFGKALGLLCMPVIIVGVFYGYTALLGTHNFLFDIFLFLLAVSVGQFVSYRLYLAPELGVPLQWLGILMVAGMLLAFVIFTYLPPHVFLFEHVATHEYGILAHY